MMVTDRAALFAASYDPTSILWASLYLIAALLVGAVVYEVFRRYYRAERTDGLSASDQLAHFQSLYEQGAISEEEFNSLRAVLGGELRRAARKPAPASNPPPAPPQTSEAVKPPDRPTPPPPETGIKPA